MWKNIIDKIEKISKENVQTYILEYAKTFSLEIYSLNKTIDMLSTLNVDLFPERKTLTECLNNGLHIDLLISSFFNWDDLDWSSLFIHNEKIPLSTAFNETSKFFIYKEISFTPEILLSEDHQNRTLIFLFLYFLPCSPPDLLLYHHQKHIPLLTYHHITNNHFDMLLYLMQNYDEDSFTRYCEDYNLNHLLIENFLDNVKELLSFQEDMAWENVLPLYKIHILLEYGCNFNLFMEYREKKHFFTFADLPRILSYLEKEYFNNKLKATLSHKHINKDIVHKI